MSHSLPIGTTVRWDSQHGTGVAYTGLTVDPAAFPFVGPPPAEHRTPVIVTGVECNGAVVVDSPSLDSTWYIVTTRLIPLPCECLDATHPTGRAHSAGVALADVARVLTLRGEWLMCPECRTDRHDGPPNRP